MAYLHFEWTGDEADAPDWLKPRLRRSGNAVEFNVYKDVWESCRPGHVFMTDGHVIDAYRRRDA